MIIEDYTTKKIRSRGAAVLCTLSVHGSSIDSPKAVFGNKQPPPLKPKL